MMDHLKQQVKKSNSRLSTLLPILLIFGLFPYGWLADKWPAFDRFTGFIFETEAAHVAGHVALFVLLATAVLILFPRLRRSPSLFFGIVISIAILQEYFQLISFKNRPVKAADIFDLAVDLLAAAVIFIFFHIRLKQETAKTAQR